MSSLKSKVYLISVVGNDQNSMPYVKKKISEYKILNMIITYENSRKTNIKERFVNVKIKLYFIFY